MMGYFVFPMTMEQAAGRQNREDFFQKNEGDIEISPRAV